MTIERAITVLAEIRCVISTKDEKAKLSEADLINGLTMAIEALEFMKIHQCRIREAVLCDSERCFEMECLDLTEEEYEEEDE